MTGRVDHFAEAQKHIDAAHEQQGRDGEYDDSVQHNATLAVAEATLALAEQHRYLNILALVFNGGVPSPDVVAHVKSGLGLA